MIADPVDINKVVVPYKYQPFPKHVHKAGGRFKRVENDAELQQALARGWSLTRIPDPTPPVEDDEPVAVAADPLNDDEVLARLAAPRKRRGRPPKVKPHDGE